MDSRTPPEILADVPPAVSAAKARGAGYAMLMVTALTWGINWPVGKHLLHELPPLSMRGAPGLVGAALLALVAVAKGQSLRVPMDQWARLVLFSILNVSAWMALIGLALVYLPAGETAVIGASMPVWAAVLAWPVLGERITLGRFIAMVMAIAGLVILLGGNSAATTQAKEPGILLALSAAFAFGLGTVLTKCKPLRLPPLTAAVWQLVIGCLPIVVIGWFYEHPNFAGMSTFGWTLFVYCAVLQMCIGFYCWFGALERLPASVAAIGTLLIPVIGVLASAFSLGEPLGVTQLAALGLTVAGVAIASRS